MPKSKHKQMDKTSAAQAQFLDQKREAWKRKRKPQYNDRYGRGGARR